MKTRYLTILLSFAFIALGLPVFAQDGGTTELVSVASDGTQANQSSEYPAISGDGRYVAFKSYATNLVPGDTNGKEDVFVRDRLTGVTTRVSVASDGTQGSQYSFNPAISGDGRYITFESYSNLVPGYSNLYNDVFVHDQLTGETTIISFTWDGEPSGHHCGDPAISADGRYVAFDSFASNLVPGDTNSADDVFVRDRQTGAITRVSVDSSGAQANDHSVSPALSADGRYVAFSSLASNLVPGDTNGLHYDVFVHDQQTGITTRVSVASDGTQADKSSYSPVLSADGRYVAFMSYANTLVPGDTGMWDIFVHDRQTGQTTRVSEGPGGTQANQNSGYEPAISADGRYVAFSSYASNLVAGDTNGTKDVFVHDRQTGITTRVSVAADGTQTASDSDSPGLSADGRYVAFSSSGSNLVPGDTNSRGDIFVHIRSNLDAPVLISPRTKTITNDNTPTFIWNTVESGAAYRIEIARNTSFIGPVQRATLTESTYTVQSLPNGIYYWRVRATDAENRAGPWSTTWTLKIDTTAPPPPPMRFPLSGATLADPSPRFGWEMIEGVTGYVFQLAADDAFAIILIDETVESARYNLPTDLLPGSYWWRVASVDEAGNWSEWAVATFIIEPVSDTPTETPPSDDPPVTTPAPPVIATLEPQPPAQWSAPTQAPPPGKEVPDSTATPVSDGKQPLH